MNPKRIFISAGEASGDMHAAAVIRALKRRYPGIEITGVAGPNMIAAGCTPLFEMHELNVIGFTEILTALPRLNRIRDTIISWSEEHHPDVIVLVDYPGFHMRLGQRLRPKGFRVVQYIAPKLWSWGKKRLWRLAASQDRLASILPFEPEWFAGHGIRADYVGNPSAYACRDGWNAAEFRERLGLAPDAKLLALLPGSRPGELANHVPVLVEVAERLKAKIPELRFVVPRAPGVSDEQLAPLFGIGAIEVDRMEEGYALRADAAVAVSGTATLELALWDVPTVLVYRASAITIFLARKLATVTCAGLANIILGDRFVMPELIQEHCTPEKILAELLPLLENGEEAAIQLAEFAKLKALLGDASPAEGVVDMIAGLAAEPRR